MEEGICGRLNKVLENQLKELWIPTKFFNSLKNSWFYKWDIIERFRRLKDVNWIDYKSKIDDFLKSNPKLTPEEAYAIFWYTDYIFYENMNNTLKAWVELTSQENRFIQLLKWGLKKLPNIQWKLQIQYRGDNWEERIKMKWWDTWKFRHFVSTSNPATKKYWDGSDVHITIATKTAKNLDDISMIKNFWDKLSFKWEIVWKSIQESIILPWTKYRVIKDPVFINGKREILLEEL
jgi:hypothetical protein